MKNFVTPEIPFASAAIGRGDVFVSEVDESDGSIALFHPTIAVLGNISLDHKSMDELRFLFGGFAAKAETVVLNLDNAETRALAGALPPRAVSTYSLSDPGAHLVGGGLALAPEGVRFEVRERGGDRASVALQMPGSHNAANALAAIGAARACGISLSDAAAALATFTGIRRRFERVGAANGVTVIDDFAHNPDKIAATLATLHAFPGRVLALFQPHGFGPLKLMKDGLVECFAANLADGDVLAMPDPVYYGGTTTREVTSGDIVRAVTARGRTAFAFEDRAACGEKLLGLARPGDRIVVMGARDDTLSDFAAGLVRRLASAEPGRASP